MPESFIEGWRHEPSASTGGLTEVSPTHPLRLFYGNDDFARARFVMMTVNKPALPQLSDLVKVERGQRELDHKWTLSFTLLDDRVREVFLRLAEDLVRRSQDAASEIQAMSEITSTLDDWRRLLRARGTDVLTLEELRGLVGETWAALRLFEEHDTAEVVRAWVGPHGHPQDFAFAAVGTFEIKAVGSTTKKINISSAEQLDSPGLALELIVLTVSNAAETTPGAITLTGIAAELRHALTSTGADGALLDTKFEALGVDLRHTFYSETWFTVDALQRYEVRDDFPAIRASEVPHAISAVQYQIARSSISPFEVEARTMG